jgi:hypothetical protein
LGMEGQGGEITQLGILMFVASFFSVRFVLRPLL